MMKKKPFRTIKGVGLDALFGDEPDNSPTPNTIDINLIVLPSSQPRHYFDPDKLEQLTQSIKTHGILEPLLVRPIADDKYELIAGERRYRAALDLKLATVPVSIKTLTDSEAKQIALIENLQRVDLNPVEETEGILDLLSIQLNQDVEEIISLLYRMHNEDKNKVTHNVVGKNESEQVKSVFQDLGLIAWQSFVSHRLPLLKLPEDILTILREGKIAYTKAIALSKIKDEQLREELTQEAIKNNLSLREIKARIKELTEEDKETVEQKIDVTLKQIKKKKLWKNEPKKWKKVEQLLERINGLLDE